jgi:hypothetical protein
MSARHVSIDLDLHFHCVLNMCGTNVVNLGGIAMEKMTNMKT